MKNKEIKNVIETTKDNEKQSYKIFESLKRHKKILVPSFILFLLIGGIGGAKLKENSFFASPYGENYAYKDIVGINSPYLIPWEREKHIVDIELGVVEQKYLDEPTVVLDGTQNNSEDKTDTNDNEIPSQNNEDKDSGEIIYGVDAGYSSEDEEPPFLDVIERGNTELEKIADDLFNSMKVITNDIDSDVEKAIKETDTYYVTKAESALVKTSVPRLINGTFAWNYKNENNKTDYLAFRVGTYIYDNHISSVPLVYERTYKKVLENKVIIKPSYNDEDVRVYIHDKIGGYIVHVPVTLEIEENGNKTTKELVYMARFTYRTPSPVDIWPLWSTREKGVFMVDAEFALHDIKGGEN